jgi:hypothetical protein
LNHSFTIRQYAAGFFLLLFSFCITPKRFLHDLLANHKDEQTSANLPVQQITSSGFHCNVDDLVVVAPFIPGIQTAVPGLLPSTVLSFSEPINKPLFSCLSHADSRGPPACFCA